MTPPSRSLLPLSHCAAAAAFSPLPSPPLPPPTPRHTLGATSTTPLTARSGEGGVWHSPRVLMQGRRKSRRRTPTRIPLYSYKDSLCVILLGLLPCNRLGTRPLHYIKEGRVPRRTWTIPPGINIQAQGAILLRTGRRVATPAT
jgi:hypothetical protein